MNVKTKEPQKHLPLTGEENPEQLDLEGRIYKLAISPLIIERATQLAEALDEVEQAQAHADSRQDELDQAFVKLKDRDTFVDASTMAGNAYRFYPKTTSKIVHKKIAVPMVSEPKRKS